MITQSKGIWLAQRLSPSRPVRMGGEVRALLDCESHTVGSNSSQGYIKNGSTLVPPNHRTLDRATVMVQAYVFNEPHERRACFGCAYHLRQNDFSCH